MKPNNVSIEVGIRAIILNMENVEDAAQTFQAKVYFELVWKALPGDWEVLKTCGELIFLQFYRYRYLPSQNKNPHEKM